MVLVKASVHHSSAGFTLVEAIVTLAVLGIFLTGFFQGYVLLESQRVAVARQAIANDTAYSNLRKFTTLPIGVACSASGTPLNFTPENVGPGGAITSQTVTVYPIGDCNTATITDTSPVDGVRIESKVIYDRGKEVSHANVVK